MQEEFIKLKIGEEAEKEAKHEIIEEKTKKILKEYEKPLHLPITKQLQAITTQEYRPVRATPPRRLVIPPPNLPSRLQYIRPFPTEQQFDLGKLNPFVQDVFVETIECDGPEENIVVTTPARKTTDVKLSKEEIDDILNTFSREAKIPLKEGILRMAVGRLVISAIISEVVGTKFIIKKMKFPPLIQGRY